jgi:hypothetical protein
MCDFGKGFVLCTCKKDTAVVEHNKNSRKHKKQVVEKENVFRWYLSEFVESFEPIMEGEYEPPVSDIGNGLSAEWVLLNLNDGNCFDVDYTPKEGDNLVINHSRRTYVRLSFVFRSGSWIEGYYYFFGNTLRLMINGKVNTIEENG